MVSVDHRSALLQSVKLLDSDVDENRVPDGVSWETPREEISPYQLLGSLEEDIWAPLSKVSE